MAIVDKIKANIKAAGGDTSGIRNIEDAVAKMGASSGGGGAVVVPFVINQDESITIPVKASELFELCSTKSVIARLSAEGNAMNLPIILSQRIERQDGFDYEFLMYVGTIFEDPNVKLVAAGDDYPYREPIK